MTNLTKTNLVKVYFEECEHTNSYTPPVPQIGESAFCQRCRDYRTVKALGVFDARCQKKSCGFARTSRPTLEAAVQTARVHIKTRSTHEVWVRENDTAVYYVKHLDEGLLTQGEALVQASHDAQKILRKFQETLDVVLPTEDSSSHDQRRGNRDPDGR